MLFDDANEGKLLPKSKGEGEFHIGYRGHDIPVPAETLRIVFTQPPGKDAVIYIYFQDTNMDVGRLEFPRDVFERLFKQGYDLLAENKPERTAF